MKWLIWMGIVIAIISGVGALSLYISKNNQAKADGEIIAKEFNDCQNKFVETIVSERKNFVDSFDCKKYKTREDAIDALKGILDEHKQSYEQKMIETQDKYNSVRTKYESNRLWQLRFDKTFKETLKDNQFKADYTIDTTINGRLFQSCLTCLLPMRPSEEQVRKDLCGHKLKGTKDNPFFDDSWNFLIGESSIETISIVSDEYIDKKLIYLTNLIVREGGHYLDVCAKIIYEPSDSKKEWRVVDVITQSVDIKKTATYEDAIEVRYHSSQIDDDFFMISAELINRNESPLLVGINKWNGSAIGWDSLKITLNTDTTITYVGEVDDGSNKALEFIFIEKL